MSFLQATSTVLLLINQEEKRKRGRNNTHETQEKKLLNIFFRSTFFSSTHRIFTKINHILGHHQVSINFKGFKSHKIRKEKTCKIKNLTISLKEQEKEEQ